MDFCNFSHDLDKILADSILFQLLNLSSFSYVQEDSPHPSGNKRTHVSRSWNKNFLEEFSYFLRTPEFYSKPTAVDNSSKVCKFLHKLILLQNFRNSKFGFFLVSMSKFLKKFSFTRKNMSYEKKYKEGSTKDNAHHFQRSLFEVDL